jgi:Ran GTPase-activating protein (RanGAP) involved in mRNA processing and transport
MEELEQLLARSPEHLNLFTEGLQLGRVGAHALSQHCAATPRLSFLELRGSSLGHQGALHLAKGLDGHPSLTHLGLARNGLDTAAVVALCHALRLAPLRHLDLEWNSVDNAAAAAVATLLAVDDCSLRTLTLERNDLRAAGAVSLADALRTNTSLVNLNLGFNRVGNSGASALANVLAKYNHTLLTLNLSTNDVAQEGGRALAACLCANKTLRNLNLQGNQCAAALFERREALVLSDNFRELNMHANKIATPAVGDDIGHALQGSLHLAALSFAATAAGDATMAAILSGISFMPAIAVLDLSHCGLGSTCMPLLSDILGACPALHTLLIDRNPIGVQGAQIIATGLKSAAALTCLGIAECGVKSAGMDALTAALTQRAGLPMRSIHARSNDIDTEACCNLCAALMPQAALEVLDVADNRIAVRAAPVLLRLLERHRGLTTVAVRDNPIADMMRTNYVDRHLLAAYLDSSAAAPASSQSPTGAAAPAAVATRPAASESPAATAKSPPRGRANAAAPVPASPTKSINVAEGRGQLVLTRASTAETTTALTSWDTQRARSGYTSTVNTSMRRSQPAMATTADRVAGLAVIDPVAFNDRRAQLHDVEANAAELCISENQLRLKFLDWDRQGAGRIPTSEFIEKYMTELVVPLPSDRRRITELAGKYAKEGKIGFQEFSILTLQLAGK